MKKTILITGSTDGIGLETAKLLVSQGHRVLLHGRNQAKLDAVVDQLANLPGGGPLEGYVADLSQSPAVEELARQVSEKHDSLDVLINNAGVFQTPSPITPEGLDVRFAVNTLAPYRLTRRLVPLLGPQGRVVNLSSAAQAPVNLDALTGKVKIGDAFAAYAQSKLALTQWSHHLAQEFGGQGPAIIAVNPGSLLTSKMVKDGFGVAGNDLGTGADILTRASLSDEFSDASGRYFDNDKGAFSSPHPDALDPQKNAALVSAVEGVMGA